jgi:cytochrome c biogenesis protein CcmG, thiol:disulfide interchange protein DsbE
VRRVWLLLPAIAFIGLLVWAVVEQGDAPVPGDAAPAFAGTRLGDDGRLALDDLRGTPVVLNFWASWCGPCEEEAPFLSSAAKEYEGRIQFVGINIKDAHDDAVEFVESHDLDYMHVRDEDLAIYDDYGLTGQPETFFIDADGVIVEHVRGGVPEDDFYRMLDVLVARDA